MRIFILVISVVCVSFTAHKFYVSNTLIEHNPLNHSLEITMTVFTDDIEIAAEKISPKKLRLGDKREFASADSIIQVYLKDKFVLTLDGNPAQWDWIGKEVENDHCYIYLERTNVPEVKSLVIRNSILCEEFDEQINMVDCIVDGKASNFGFTKEQTESILYQATK